MNKVILIETVVANATIVGLAQSFIASASKEDLLVEVTLDDSAMLRYAEKSCYIPERSARGQASIALFSKEDGRELSTVEMTTVLWHEYGHLLFDKLPLSSQVKVQDTFARELAELVWPELSVGATAEEIRRTISKGATALECGEGPREDGRLQRSTPP